MSGIGTFNRRVTLDTAGPPVPDGDGGFTETLMPLSPAVWWCSVEPATAADMERMIGASVVQTTATHLLRGRFHAGITTATRITLAGRVLQVQSVQDDHDDHRRLVVLCAEAK